MKVFRKLLTLVFAFGFVFTAFMLISATKVNAHRAGETVQHTGTLERHTNTAFTHSLNRINLIINSFFDNYIGKNVTATVRYVDNNFNFVVDSIVLTDSQQNGVGSPAPEESKTQAGNVLDGTLSLSPLAGHAYRITPANGFPVDIIVPRNYDAWLGSNVRLTYSGSLSGFSVLGLARL